MGSDRLLNQFNVDSGAELAQKTAAREENSRGFIGEAWESAKYSGLQAPIHGVTQLFDGAFKTDLTKAATFMERPKEAHTFEDWHAQQIGGALGMAVPFIALNFGVHKGANKLLGLRAGATTAESVGVMSMRRAVTEAAIAGGIYEGVFNPSDPNENLGVGRLKHFVQGAATFGALTLGARGLHDSGLLKNRIGIGVVSGIPAGVVSSQLDSVFQGKGFASVDDTIKGAYGFAMVGGFLSAVHSIPLGDRAKAPTDKAPTTGNAGTEIAPSEFRIADAQSRQALEAFRKGETPSAWAEIQRAGEPRRTLFVQHEGVPFELASRADFVALCNLPEVSPLSRKLALPGATDRPIFMDMPGEGERVRFSTEPLSPEALKLGPKENRAKVESLLDNYGINPDEMPPWLGQVKPTGVVWEGANSVVIDLANRPGMPEVVLKVKRADFDGQRWFEADIYDHKGKVDPTAVHETTDSSNNSPLYMFLESRHDFNPADSSGYSEFMQSLAEKGIQLEPGSGPPVGKDVNTGKWSVTDRDSTSTQGSGVHDVERAAAMGGEAYEEHLAAEEKAAGKDTWDDGYGQFDISDEVGKRGSIDGLKLNPVEEATATRLFGKKPIEQIRALLSQLTDGLSTAEDVEIMQTYAVAGGNEGVAKQQIRLAADIAKSRKLPVNDWVGRYRGK